MGNFSVDEKNKCIAYKELIEELNQQIKEKENAIQNLEVEYFKKWLLNNVLKNNTEVKEINYKKEAIDIEEKIHEEENLIGTLELTISELEEKYRYKYGKQQ